MRRLKGKENRKWKKMNFLRENGVLCTFVHTVTCVTISKLLPIF